MHILLYFWEAIAVMTGTCGILYAIHAVTEEPCSRKKIMANKKMKYKNDVVNKVLTRDNWEKSIEKIT